MVNRFLSRWLTGPYAGDFPRLDQLIFYSPQSNGCLTRPRRAERPRMRGFQQAKIDLTPIVMEVINVSSRLGANPSRGREAFDGV